jgi:hypothetical protein
VYAGERARQFSIELFVSGCYGKDERDGEGHYRTEHLCLDGGPVVFVDDRPEDLAADFEVVAVSPYLSDDPHDRGLDVVARRAGLSQ